MKTLTFFNEKGGSGKSTFCLMMASWLRYACGARVAVIDLDDPMHSIDEIRRLDRDTLASGGKELLRFIPSDADPDRDWYPVIPAAVDGGPADQKRMEALIRCMQDDYDYVLLDFGGSLSEGDTVVTFLRSGIIDLLVVPVYTDETVMLSALELCFRARRWGQRQAVFWNRVTRSERPCPEKNRFAKLSSLFTKDGTPVLDTFIPEMVMFRRDCRTWRFLRSTACWPSTNVRLLCPELETLFKEIRSMLDGGDEP